MELEAGDKDSERLIDQRQGETSIQNLNDSKSVSLEVSNLKSQMIQDH